MAFANVDPKKVDATLREGARDSRRPWAREDGEEVCSTLLGRRPEWGRRRAAERRAEPRTAPRQSQTSNGPMAGL